MESDFTTGSFTHRYNSALAVELTVDHARIGRAVYAGVRLEDSLRVLHQLVTKSQFADASAVVPATTRLVTRSRSGQPSSAVQACQPSTAIEGSSARKACGATLAASSAATPMVDPGRSIPTWAESTTETETRPISQ
jgi:hypothetical protein